MGDDSYMLITKKVFVFGTRCDTILVNTTLSVDKGDTVVLNCTRFCADGISLEGPDGSKAMPNETVLMAYSDGLLNNPNIPITNIAIYMVISLEECVICKSKTFRQPTMVFTSVLISCLVAVIFEDKTYLLRVKPPTDLTIVNASQKNIIYGTEGVRMELECTVKPGMSAATLIWSKDGLSVSNDSSDNLLYGLTPTRFDHMKSITCYACSDLLRSPLTLTI
ncbi:unnamed protein product [Mytilus coruscus]|uniref:Ig-like domain-containing protein n=1 Tax=Mytilus coruscus TaxID=42192 RepID=A0A6J8BC42_MYTCO|nr:unnamed protein product [Mytilus coruscus]